jgi:hypothetical protein
MCAVRQSKQVLIADFPESKVIFNLETYLPHILNETASEIWDFCRKPRQVGQMSEFLCKKYDISPSKSKKDVIKLIARLKKIGLFKEAKHGRKN